MGGAAFLPEALGGNLFLCLLRQLEAPGVLGSRPLHLQGPQHSTSSPSLTLLPPSFLARTPVIAFRAHLDHPGQSSPLETLNRIMQSPFCHVREHIHRLQGIGCGPLWGERNRESRGSVPQLQYWGPESGLGRKLQGASVITARGQPQGQGSLKPKSWKGTAGGELYGTDRWLVV